MKDWKDQIGKHFIEKGISRKDDMNMMLSGWLKEWAEYMNHFEGIHTNQGAIPADDNYSRRLHYVVVMGGAEITSFKVYLGFFADEQSGKLCLEIKSVTGINHEGILSHYPRGDDRLMVWTEFDVYCEPEIFEKDYVLGLLNSRFFKFNDEVELI